MVFKPRHNDIRGNKLVIDWYKNLQGGSLITAETYLRTLGLYCKLTKNTPESILEKAKNGDLKSEFINFVNDLQSQGKAGSYITRFKKVWILCLNLIILIQNFRE